MFFASLVGKPSGDYLPVSQKQHPVYVDRQLTCALTGKLQWGGQNVRLEREGVGAPSVRDQRLCCGS